MAAQPADRLEVSEADRRALARQARALDEATITDEGDEGFQRAVEAWANAERKAAGRATLRPWWAEKTEPEFHRRARSLGLLD